jgi:endonuclease G
MKPLLFSFYAFFIICLLAFCKQEVRNSSGEKIPDNLQDIVNVPFADSLPTDTIHLTDMSRLEIPKTKPEDSIISHTGYSILFNDAYKQAEWVAYELTKDETNNVFTRTDKFVPDPDVKTGTATESDYSGSGFDRGHLAPAADMGWSATAIAESFYYSNMSPQTPGFNRGIWKKLEEQVRTWAIENDSLYIVTGPVLTKGLRTIGEHKVAVPDFYYKVILDYTEPGINGIGFILRNASSGLPLKDFAVTIDSVEKFTGFDFFPLLPDNQEQIIEKTLCDTCWSWKSTKKKSAK